MKHQSVDIQSVRIVDRSIVFDYANNLETTARHQPCGHSAYVSKPLNDDACVLGRKPEYLERFEGGDHAASTRGFGPTARPAKFEWLAGDDSCYCMAAVHRVGVHDPRHRLFIGVYIGGGHIPLGTDEFPDFRSVTARDSF